MSASPAWLERHGGPLGRLLLPLLLLAPLAASLVLAVQSFRLGEQYRLAVKGALGLEAEASLAGYRQRFEAVIWMLADALLQGPLEDPKLQGEGLLAELERALAALPGCRCAAPVRADAIFWEDLATGAGGDRALGGAGAFDRALLDNIRARHSRYMELSAPFAASAGHRGERPWFILYAARVRPQARPLVYGFLLERSSLEERVFSAAQVVIHLPTVKLAAGESWWPYLSIAVRDADGRPLWQSVPQYPPTYSAHRRLWNEIADIDLHLALNPRATDRLIPGGLPPSPLPLLSSVVAGSAAFAAVGLLLLLRTARLHRAHREFTARITHELRTPLTQTLLYAESLLFERLKTPERRAKALTVIVREVRHLIHLIDNALVFARAGRSATGLAREELHLSPLLREVLEALAPLLASRECRLEAALEEGLVAVVDQTALRQIATNLVDNAARHGPRGGWVAVRLAAREGAAVLTVEDGGPGIPAAERERVFKPFVRLAGRGEGSGLGLAIVRQLVELSGGEIAIGDAPGGGARFTVRFPLAPPAGAGAPIPRVAEA